MSWNASPRIRFVYGHVPSGCGKSLPHMMVPTPISYRRASSRRRVFDDPILMLRSKYSLGSIVSRPRTLSSSLREPWSLRMSESERQSRSGTQYEPASVTAIFSPGKRSNTPDHSRNHSGRDVHHTVSLAYNPSTPGTAP